MLAARKVLDAASAFSCGGGVVLIAAQLKPIPEALSYLGWFTFGWMVLMVIGCAGAGIGAMLRNRSTDIRSRAYRRRLLGIRMERVCWPAIAWAALVFIIGIIAQIGFIAGAATISWTGFVIFTCVGHWWVIRQAAKGKL